MPRKAGRLCSHPGCPNITHEKYCEAHRKQTAAPSAAARGYDSRWQRARVIFLHKHPLCVACQQHGRLTAATVVDHVVPHRGDRELFWNEANWQPLCKPCHDEKTATEDGGFGRNIEYRY